MIILPSVVLFVCHLWLTRGAEQATTGKSVADDSSPSCQCVSLYQCDENNGEIITDGTGLIAFRSGSACSSEEVCCEIPAKGPDSGKDGVVYIDDGEDDVVSPPEQQGADLPSVDVPGEEEDQQIGSPTPFICGLRQSVVTSTKISGDNDDTYTEQGDFPWTLIVKYLVPVEEGVPNEQLLVCGASLISPSLAITSAHNIERKIEQNLIVRAGEWDLGSDDESIAPQESAVQRVIFHPKFDAQPIQYDIAILVLKTPFQSNAAVNTVCLPDHTQNHFKWSKCYATGWGAAADGAYPKDNAVMRKSRMPLVNHDDCQGLLRKTEAGKRFRLHHSFLCAGGDGTTDTCKGDGGGPLACESPVPPYKFYLVGVTSWGVGCSRKGVPGAYTNVSAVAPWISETVKKLLGEGFIP